ncbi:MAG: hypothetical protein U9Q12_04625, partial [Patescibacteria group bacterium]|nr:hypothetical protein [Patescibacteria group bacterium]
YKDVHEWAGKRAHGLAQEFAQAHPGIDIDMVQPGTALNLDLSNPADVRVDIDFEGGPRTLAEVDTIAELTKNPEFNTALATQIKEIAGVEDIQNIANTQISLFESNDGGAINSKINGVIHRAQQAFGDSVGAPQNNATVGSYVTRIFARATQEGKVKDIFPSSDFSV